MAAERQPQPQQANDEDEAVVLDVLSQLHESHPPAPQPQQPQQLQPQTQQPQFPAQQQPLPARAAFLTTDEMKLVGAVLLGSCVASLVPVETATARLGGKPAAYAAPVARAIIAAGIAVVALRLVR